MSDEIQNAAEASNMGTPANDTRSPTEYFTPPEATPSGASGSGTRAEVVVHIVDAPVIPVAAPSTPVTPLTLVPAPSSSPAVAASGGERGTGRGGRGRCGGRVRGFPVRTRAARAGRARGQIPAAQGAHHTSTFGSLIALFDRALDGLEGLERITMASIICCSLAFVAVIIIVIVILMFF